MTRKKSGRGGFTLIELLIVIAIAGILVAVMIPFYREMVENGITTGTGWKSTEGMEYKSTLTVRAKGIGKDAEDAYRKALQERYEEAVREFVRENFRQK